MRDAHRLPATILGTLASFAGAAFNTQSSYKPTLHIWSRGLALMCDHNGGFDYVRKQRGGGRSPLPFDPADYSSVLDGDLVWVRSTSVSEFVKCALPLIDARFALVTGDEDLAAPSDFESAAEILANPNVICWFAQNFDSTDTSGKVRPIPIGVDFHTLANGRKWKHWQSTPARQESELERVRAKMPPNASRLLCAHADFHFNMGKQRDAQSREALHRLLIGIPNVHFQRRKLPRHDLWIEKTKYAFAVSPHGHGLDCHRTWESLLLGNIPIVRSSSLDELYEELPVVVVDDFSEISTQSLRRWHAEFRDSFGRVDVQERLTNGYWIERIRSLLHERMNAQSA